MTKRLLLCFFTTLVALNLNSQTDPIVHALVNRDTVIYYGATDTIDLLPIQINTNGNVVIAGNQKLGASQYDGMLASGTTDAMSVWLNTFNAGGTKMFVTASWHDISGNIYTVGGVRTPTTNGLDYFLMKSDISGTQIFLVTYDGTGGGNDVASGLCLDASNNVYVTGASDGTFPELLNYSTVKFDGTTGAQIWDVQYNYNNSMDVATSIAYDAAANSVIVSGASGVGLNPQDFDIATVAYDETSGSQLYEERAANTAGIGQDKVFGMVTDSLGNVYVTGTTYNGANYDGLIQKLDTSLVPIWTKIIDLHGFDDAAVSVNLDDSLNVYVTGTSHTSSTDKELFLYKFKPNGDTAWKAPYKSAPGISTEGLRVKVKSYNEIFVGGSIITNGNQDVAVFRFNKNGHETMNAVYNGTNNAKDQLMDFELTGNKIIASARSFNGTMDDNVLVYFEYRDIPFVPVKNLINGNQYCEKEVIVRFNKQVLKMDKINRQEINFGKLSDFVQDSTCDKIEELIDPDNIYRINAKTLPVYKMNNLFTEKDSISISRIGDTVKIPEFYGSFIVQLPPMLNSETVTDTLQYIKPDISWSQLNNVYTFEWVPNDTIYPHGQTNLHGDSIYPNAHINVEKAWDYTTGEPFVRVGVYDSGIYEVINDDIKHITEHHCMINFYHKTVVDNIGHGSAVAGIIGAKSDNTLGIAGIAGGGNGNPGATMVIIKVVSDNTSMASDAWLKTAYTMGATDTTVLFSFQQANNAPRKGMGLHIMNNSYSKKNLASSPEMLEGIYYANQNGVAFVASRTNYVPSYATLTPPIPINANCAPATLKPGVIMNVGASGTDGHYHLNGVNGNAFTSMHGKGVDFVAPGSALNVSAPHAFQPMEQATSSAPPPTVNSFTTFSGTSASAAHVSGVAALMMSYRNQSGIHWDNLVHEDVEAILKRSATDLSNSGTYFESVGNDTVTGYGRINADSALNLLQPKYKIRHIDLTHHSTSASTSTAIVAQNTAYVWQGSSSLMPAMYNVDIIEHTITYTYPFGSETLIDAWPLYKASAGMPPPPAPGQILINDEPYHVEIVNVSNTSATLKNYEYKFNYWYSNSPMPVNVTLGANWKAAFTLYTLGDPLSGIVDKNPEVAYFRVYPNPSNGDFTMGYTAKNNAKARLRVSDMTGRLVYEDNNLQVITGINRTNLALEDLPAGIYLINLDVESNKPLTGKIVISK